LYSSTQISTIDQRLAENEDELFVRLSTEISSHRALALPPSREEAIKKAKVWLEENRRKISNLVCNEKILVATDQLKEKDGRQAALLLVDALLSSFGFFPAVCISVLVLRQSLQIWCEPDGK